MRGGCSRNANLLRTTGVERWRSRNAAAIARNVVDAFEGFDYVVAPSGSCAGMIKRHYPEVLKNDPRSRHRRLRPGDTN